MDFKKIEKKWQETWEKDGTFEAKESKSKDKFYILEMFPYPSAAGLHMGHAFNYTIGDIYARFKRMKGFNILHPMGYDSLGLPAENAAIKEGTHPQDYTRKSINNFIKQQRAIGLSYDWSRKVVTSEPDYYKWDQWIFLKMLEKGLAYKKKSPVNWCPKCQTVLANEQVHDGHCWRHETTRVEVKHLEQWYFKITDYADELYEGIDKLTGWPDLIKKLQKNWIGKSHGTEIDFEINGQQWRIFTTRPDTLFGVTFLVVSAQHPRLAELVTKEQKATVDALVKKLSSVSEEQIDQLEKEGAFTGSYAIHPLTKEKIPVYAGNFVLADYGCGMVMAVPAHDQRDFEFANKYKIPIKIVIHPKDKKFEKLERAFTNPGILANSAEFNGLESEKAKEQITKALEKKNLGGKVTNFRLRDWLISRQRYWGTPIPVVYCDKCGIVPVPEKDLPVELPREVKFGGANPLTTNDKFVNTKCPKCNGKATRETDTMDTFVNSSWYQLRYTDPKNDKKIFDPKKAAYWNPVDLYIGGKEHACMHLIYVRFYTKFLRDLGLLKIDEPAVKLFNQGMLHGEDGNKMSKSLGNVIDPLDVSDKYGADTLRFFIISVAAPDSDFNWSETGVQSSHKFLNRVAGLFEGVKPGKSDAKTQSRVNKAVNEVTEDIENMRYNLAVIKLRALLESLETGASKKDRETFLKLLNPFCPHITEELWQRLGNKNMLCKQKWPVADEKKINPDFEQEDKLAESLTHDIRDVFKLAKIENPKRIMLITPEPWKYELFRIAKEKLETTRNPSEIFKAVMGTELKKHGQDITKILPKIIDKLPERILKPDEEHKALTRMAATLKEEFKCEVQIVKAQESKEQKAKQAMPGKPAIVVE